MARGLPTTQNAGLDSTRVVLTNYTPDYIHANWVGGSQGPRMFICSQGPTDNTLTDFWTMVWQVRYRNPTTVTHIP